MNGAPLAGPAGTPVGRREACCDSAVTAIGGACHHELQVLPSEALTDSDQGPGPRTPDSHIRPRRHGGAEHWRCEMGTVFELLDHEWRQISSDRTAATRLVDVCRLAGGARSLGDVERYVRSAAPADADRILLALVARVLDGEQLAARVLLQLLLPGARRLANRWWALGDPEERAAATIAAVYRRMRTYPLHRRPGKVAVNILMDAALDLRRAVPRLRLIPSPDPAGRAPRVDNDDRTPPHPATELAELLLDAMAEGVIDRDDAEVIAQSRIADAPVPEIAARRGVGARTIWRRRERAELALRA
jgi:DNA-directed RNA polymerase specialized sigma24 family protein